MSVFIVKQLIDLYIRYVYILPALLHTSSLLHMIRTRMFYMLKHITIIKLQSCLFKTVYLCYLYFPNLYCVFCVFPSFSDGTLSSVYSCRMSLNVQSVRHTGIHFPRAEDMVRLVRLWPNRFLATFYFAYLEELPFLPSGLTTSSLSSNDLTT